MKKDREDFLAYEEEFHGSDRKLSRNERKLAIRQDRSKYKKTDRDKKKEEVIKEVPETALLGRVLGIHPEGIVVEAEGKTYRCRLKGALKKDKSETKNLVAVGDFVRFEPEALVILRTEPRRSVLSRADNLLRRKEQLIAVNIDLVIITASAFSPSFKPALIDRYIIAAKKGNMEPVIVVNKIDLMVTDEQKEELESYKEVYEKLGIPFLKVSAVTGEGTEALQAIMKDKSSVFSGQSGTGKSSLINILTGSSIKTGSVVAKTEKGSHTTTTATLVPLEGGGFCVDTPGIRSFGVWDLTAGEIEEYFPEIQEASRRCKFIGCSHGSEPGCAVKAAVEEGEISPIRLVSYFSLLETLKIKHRTR